MLDLRTLWMGSCWTFAVKDGEIFQPNLQSFRLISEGSNESNTWFKLRHAQTCGRDVYSTLIHVITIISLTWWNSLRLKWRFPSPYCILFQENTYAIDKLFTWWNSLGLEWISLSLIASFPHKTPMQYQHRPIRPYPALHERLCSNTILWKNICFTDKWIFWNDSQASLAASNGWVIKMKHARNDWRRRMANHKWHGPYKPPRRRSFETVCLQNVAVRKKI